MKNTRRIALLAVTLLALSIPMAAQPQGDPQKARPRTAAADQDKKVPSTTANGDRLEPDDSSRTKSDVPQDFQANRQEQMSEEVAITNYYNNFFTNYRLGPEDVISVEVFNQPRYSRANIIIPPSGRVSLSLIKGGVFVNGKTVEEVAEMVKKSYDEYIIDPQVNVSLDKATSYRYSVLGDVLQPGIRLMNHRMTVSEAIAEAGGVLGTGNKKGIVVLRMSADGTRTPIRVDLAAIYKGKVPDNTYLSPGDQILVPGNKLKKLQQIMSLTPLASFARVFGAPVP